MVVSVGGAAVGAQGGPARPGHPGPAGSAVHPAPAPAGGTRRDITRGLLASAFALALAPVVAASRPTHPEPPRPADGPGDVVFDETYRGRRIRGVRTSGGRAARTGGWEVTLDGRPLHLMRRADGTWLSMVDHYGSYPTALEAARAAVDALGPGQRLRAPAAPLHGGSAEGGHHGVHA